MRISTFASKHAAVAFTLLGAVIALIGYGGYRYYLLMQEFNDVEQLRHLMVVNFKSKMAELDHEFQGLKGENESLAGALVGEKERNDALENQVSGITGTVSVLSTTIGTLEKLKQIDPELLKKYSKVFFLNEHYAPKQITAIPAIYVNSTDKPHYIHTGAWPYLEKLLLKAKEEGIDLQILSAYRSFGTQSVLKSAYTITYGAGTANQFSADQGYSEHQLGTTVDFTTSSVGTRLAEFEASPAYPWLEKNAGTYGFILSYPENNTQYIFEPWHWRFVGVGLVKKLREENKTFYAMDQRSIDEYLVSIFD